MSSEHPDAGGDGGGVRAGGPGAVWPCRLDAAVARSAGVSVGRARRLLAGGGVELNGHTAGARDKGRRVTGADRVVVQTDNECVVPEPQRPLRELARGQGWVAVEKPAGVAVHPLVSGETGTVLNAAVARYPQLADQVGREGPLRTGVVHRLDVDTSGVLLLALTPDAWDRLRDAFASHRVIKTYYALVAGTPAPTGRADLHLAVTRHRPARVSVVAQGRAGARATGLAWRVREQRRDLARIEVTLETGFLHQIRVACAHLGFPVMGDRVYGPQRTSSAPRHMLHAARVTAEGMTIDCPEPPDFLATWSDS